MRINLNEIIVHRNETFTLDRYIVNADGSPYILSDQVDNQYIMIIVSSAAYSQKDRYKKTWWLPLADYPKFAETAPIDLDELVDENGDKAYTNWPAEQVSAYLGTKLISDGYDDRYYVFVHTTTVGTKEYKYWDGSAYVQYDFQFEHIFTQEETKEWGSGNYLYSIFLAAGEPVIDVLRSICLENGVDVEGSENAAYLYDQLDAKGVWKSREFDITAPLGSFSLMIPFLTPTKMTVISNLEGAMQ